MSGMYDPSGRGEVTIDTNYGINYEGEIISDILVIPYQVEIDGELYKITSVDLRVRSDNWSRSFPDVNTIIYPNTVTEIFGRRNKTAGGENSVLEKVVLPHNITCIPDGLFSACTNIKEITIPNAVTEIEGSAFFECEKLTTITIPSGVINIGEEAFWDCRSLETINIPKTVTSISKRAFQDCNAITTVNYEGTEEEWNAITIGSYNSTLTNATINYNYNM